MSMPGFVFYFRCDSCGVTSGEYSAYVFHDLLNWPLRGEAGQ
jgi:hypothetical protein